MKNQTVAISEANANIPKDYIQKIRAVYPKMTLDRLDFNQDGLVNDVIIVNHQLVCRFPKTDWGIEVLEHEAKILKVVSDRVELKVPHYEHKEDDFVSYRLIEGDPLSRNTLLRLTPIERERVLTQLAIFHQQLHDIAGDVLVEAGILTSGAVRNREVWLEFYQQLEYLVFPHLMRHQRTWIKEHFAPVLKNELDFNYKPVLIHGDLGVYHILFNSTKMSIEGIIDFGTAGLGDPATDIAVLLDNYGEECVRYMAKEYPILPEIIDRARFWAGTSELQWALAGIHNNDTGLLLSHIGGARAIKPVGSYL